jgi:hypothetical protein
VSYSSPSEPEQARAKRGRERMSEDHLGNETSKTRRRERSSWYGKPDVARLLYEWPGPRIVMDKEKNHIHRNPR